MNFKLESRKLKLKLTLMKAGVDIVVGDSEEVELEFAELRKKTADEVFDINFWDDTLTVKERLLKKPNMASSFFDERLLTDIMLKIPNGTETSGFITAVGGNISMGSALFDGKLKTLSGDINLAQILTSDLNINTVSGDTRIGDIAGSLTGNAISGKFLIENGEIDSISLKSVAGDIFIKSGFNLEKDGHIQTVSGDINMKIRRYKGERTLYLSTLSGAANLEGNFPEERISKKRSLPFMKQTPFKEFMPMVKEFISSLKGGRGVEVHTQWDSSDNRKNVETILNMLSEGKITPEEAERLINAVKGA